MEWTYPEPEPDGPQWAATRWGEGNKIGGTPAWLQGPESPPGAGWRFAFQLSSAFSGHDIADGAELFGFVRDDLTATFVVQVT